MFQATTRFWRFALNSAVLAVFAVACARASATEGTDPFRDAKVVAHLAPAGSRPVEFEVSGRYIALVDSGPKGRSVRILAAPDTLLYRVSVPKSLSSEAHISGVSYDGRILFFSQPDGIESYRTTAVDLEGTVRFSTNSDLQLAMSPTVRYFCNSNVFDDPGAFEVYDSTGRKVFQGEQRGAGWIAHFLSDSLIVFAEEDTVKFFDVTSRAFVGNIWLRFRDHAHVPEVCVNRDRTLVAVYDERNIIVLQRNGVILWRDSIPDYLYGAVFSDYGPEIALFLKPRTHLGGYVAVADARTGRRLTSSVQTDLLNGFPDGIGGWMWFSNDLLFFNALPSGLPKEHSQEFSTLIFSLDRGSMTFGTPVFVPNKLMPINGGQTTGLVLRCAANGPLDVISLGGL